MVFLDNVCFEVLIGYILDSVYSEVSIDHILDNECLALRVRTGIYDWRDEPVAGRTRLRAEPVVGRLLIIQNDTGEERRGG